MIMSTCSVAAFFTNTIKETLFDRVVFLLGQFGTVHDECTEGLGCQGVRVKVGQTYIGHFLGVVPHRES